MNPLLLIVGSVVGAAAIYGFVWLMRLIPAGKGAAVDHFADKPPPDKFDPSAYLQQPEGGRIGSLRDER